MADRSAGSSRNAALHSILSALLSSLCGVEAAAVISYDGLPIASALPASTDESRVAAMSAALLSLGERATEGLGRGALAEVFIEGKHGTVFLVSCEEAAVLVAVAEKGAKIGLVRYEVRHCAARVADVLRRDVDPPIAAAVIPMQAEPARWSSYAPTGTLFPGEPTSWS